MKGNGKRVEAAQRKAARKGENDVHDEVDVRLGHAEEERELEHRRQRARAPGLDRQADKAAHHELAALEGAGLSLNVVELDTNMSAVLCRVSVQAAQTRYTMEVMIVCSWFSIMHAWDTRMEKRTTSATALPPNHTCMDDEYSKRTGQTQQAHDSSREHVRLM